MRHSAQTSAGTRVSIAESQATMTASSMRSRIEYCHGDRGTPWLPDFSSTRRDRRDNCHVRHTESATTPNASLD